MTFHGFKVKATQIRAVPGEIWPTASPSMDQPRRGPGYKDRNILGSWEAPHWSSGAQPISGAANSHFFPELLPKQILLPLGLKILWFQRIFKILLFAARATKLFLLPALGSASSPALTHCGHSPASQGLHSCIKKLKSFQFYESSEQGTMLNPNPISWDQIDDYSS